MLERVEHMVEFLDAAAMLVHLFERIDDELVKTHGLTAVAYGAFSRTVPPAFSDLLTTKAERSVRMVAAELDVPLGADDRGLIERALAHLTEDPDFAYVGVRDARGQIVFARGELPAQAFAGHPGAARRGDGEISAFAPIRLDGLPLGDVALAYRTDRVDNIRTWAQRIALAVAAVWLAALLYSIGLARRAVAPLRAMMMFSRRVAGGELAARLDGAARGELGELRDYLNQMTADLERGEADRLAAARQAETLQRELMTVSRMAGMAEVATGVLHNVGNVLNSLNTSVTVIRDQVARSRVSGLTRSIALVEAYPGGLPAFLTTDKGKILPTYLASVSRQLGEENDRILAELTAVGRNVDHIKAIVAMQQSYARPIGLREPVALDALIDDALALGESSFARHGIEVIKDYADAPRLVTDRHKVLQVLINLISNARHALKDRAGPPHRLTVRARLIEGEVAVTVEDTGIGISADHMDQIFQHGFTTKPGGHGFGLHASANAARELGGRLTATSDGVDRGAAFTLWLPLDVGGRAHAARN